MTGWEASFPANQHWPRFLGNHNRPGSQLNVYWLERQLLQNGVGKIVWSWLPRQSRCWVEGNDLLPVFWIALKAIPLVAEVPKQKQNISTCFRYWKMYWNIPGLNPFLLFPKLKKVFSLKCWFLSSLVPRYFILLSTRLSSVITCTLLYSSDTG